MVLIALTQAALAAQIAPLPQPAQVAQPAQAMQLVQIAQPAQPAQPAQAQAAQQVQPATRPRQYRPTLTRFGSPGQQLRFAFHLLTNAPARGGLPLARKILLWLLIIVLIVLVLSVIATIGLTVKYGFNDAFALLGW